MEEEKLTEENLKIFSSKQYNYITENQVEDEN
jgi:hypothetical protein